MIATAAPVVDVATETLVGKAESPPDKPTADDVFLVELDIVIATVARMPFAITFEFTPQATHFRLPAVLLQEIDLIALVVADPGFTLTDEKSVVE